MNELMKRITQFDLLVSTQINSEKCPGDYISGLPNIENENLCNWKFGGLAEDNMSACTVCWGKHLEV